MSISIMKKYLNQSITYQVKAITGDGVKFGSPLNAKCRYEETTSNYTDNDGNEKVSSSLIDTIAKINEGDKITYQTKTYIVEKVLVFTGLSGKEVYRSCLL